MLQEVLAVLQNCRFPAGVLFLGASSGWYLYRVIPVPTGTADHVRQALRAGVAAMLARNRGVPPLADLADAVGIHAAGNVLALLRRQARRCLFVATLLAALVLLPVYVYAPVSVVPDWAFAILGLLGLHRAWRLW